jgi:hypothetical protein
VQEKKWQKKKTPFAITFLRFAINDFAFHSALLNKNRSKKILAVNACFGEK